jgi:hypothetical protein
MTDQQTPSTDDESSTTSPADTIHADETFGWTGSEDEPTSQGSAPERMLAQLQSMIDSIATQAGPVVKQIGAKAAELAAAAADRAGPIAHKAADATAGASVKIAERSRGFAADLRRENNGHGGTAVAEPVADTAADLREETASGEGDASGAVSSVLDEATETGDKPD